MDADADIARVAEEGLAQAGAGLAGANIRELGVRPDALWEPLPVPQDAEWQRMLRAGLASLCEAYQDHRRTGVLGAAVAALNRGAMAFADTDQGDPLAKWLLGGSPNSHPALRSMLRRSVGALGRLRAWEWLTREPVMAAAVERFAWAELPAEHDAVLRAAHLIENPDRAERIRLIQVKGSGGRGPVPDATVLTGLGVEAKRGMARMCTGLAATDSEREEWLSPFLAEMDAGVRLSVVTALGAGAVMDYCFDPEEAIATCATLKWNSNGGVSEAERRRVFENLERSPHASLRWMARVERESESGISSELSRLRELTELSQNRPETVEAIRAAIGTGSDERRLDAIMMARRLGVQSQVELELLGVVGGSVEADELGKLAAAAVSALGEAGSESAAEAVRACLGHPVARVRSNAVESLARRLRGRGDLPFCSPRLYEAMIEMKDEGSHRVRATALREILSASSPTRGGTGYEPTAAEGLLSMLGDDRPAHRLAALWAVERVASAGEVGDSLARRWDTMASCVAELTVYEGDEAVRRRAVRCARRMLARMGDERVEREAAA